MPRQSTIPNHDRTPRPVRLRVSGLLLAVIAVLAACTTTPDEPPEQAQPQAEPDPEPAVTEPDPEPEPDPEGADGDALAERWGTFHTTWMAQAAEDEPDPAAFEGVTVDPKATVELLEALRADGRLVTTDQELWPRIDIDGDAAEIVDCAIVAQHPAGQPDSTATITLSWAATATATEDGWLIETAQPGELFCIAEELNDQLLEAYTVWFEGQQEWYQPPDPDHAVLDDVMAEPGLSDMRAILADDRDSGISMRFPHDPQAVVTDVGLGTARITDCYEAPEGYGAFDVASGERRADVLPAPEPGQLNRTVADFELSADGWLVVGWRWEEQNDCEPGETRYATR